MRQKVNKKILTIVLLLAASVSLISCGKKEEAASAEDEETIVVEEAGDESEAEAVAEEEGAWAEKYLDYLNQYAANAKDDQYAVPPEERTYNLIYVNDDDIPELLLQGQDEATGNIILTYKNGEIDEMQTSRLSFTYLERGNKLCNSDGHMGMYYDNIYTIVDGKWQEAGHGEYYVEDNTVDWSDEDLIYSWNGKEVSHEEYEAELGRVYAPNNAKEGEGIYSFEEVVERLKAAGGEG